MPATVVLNRWTGSSGTPTKTSVGGGSTKLSASDSPSPGSSNPIRKPAAGTNYSFWAAFRLSATTTPAGTINALQVYFANNTLATGIGLVGNDASTYVQATGTTGTTGDILNTTNYSTLSGAAVNVFTFTSGSPKSLAGSISNPSTGDFGDFFVCQYTVASTAGPGSAGGGDMTFQYSET